MAAMTTDKDKAKRARLIALAAKIRAMGEEERADIAGRVGTITAEGKALSLYNTCFLWAQAGRVLAQVGGFRQWKRAGRSVRKGEHAVGCIYVPMVRKGKEDQGADADAGESVRFRLVPMFAIEQTDLIGVEPEALAG